MQWIESAEAKTWLDVETHGNCADLGRYRPNDDEASARWEGPDYQVVLHLSSSVSACNGNGSLLSSVFRRSTHMAHH
jgi:hypothetical protein